MIRNYSAATGFWTDGLPADWPTGFVIPLPESLQPGQQIGQDSNGHGIYYRGPSSYGDHIFESRDAGGASIDQVSYLPEGTPQTFGVTGDTSGHTNFVPMGVLGTDEFGNSIIEAGVDALGNTIYYHVDQQGNVVDRTVVDFRVPGTPTSPMVIGTDSNGNSVIQTGIDQQGHAVLQHVDESGVTVNMTIVPNPPGPGSGPAPIVAPPAPAVYTPPPPIFAPIGGALQNLAAQFTDTSAGASVTTGTDTAGHTVVNTGANAAGNTVLDHVDSNGNTVLQTTVRPPASVALPSRSSLSPAGSTGLSTSTWLGIGAVAIAVVALTAKGKR